VLGALVAAASQIFAAALRFDVQEFRQPGSVQKQFFFGLEKLTPPAQQPAYPGGPFFNFAGGQIL